MPETGLGALGAGVDAPLMWMFLAIAAAFAETPSADAEIRAKLDAGDLLAARRLAEARLVDVPDDIVAHYALGRVYLEEEGHLGKARDHLDRADALFDAANLDFNNPDWKLHSEILFYRIGCAELQEDFDAELAMMDHADEMFDPDKGADRGWPLMKLGRIEEATAVAEVALNSSDPWDVSVGHNLMCVIESEAAHRVAGAAACAAAFEHELSLESPDPTVDGVNAGSSAFTVLDYEGAEAFFRAAAKGSSDNASNPYAALVNTYLIEGRGKEALAALRQMQTWRLSQPADMRDQNRADLDAVYARLLYVAGRSDKASEVVQRAIDFPDRRAMGSDSAEQARGSVIALRRSIRALAVQREAERMASLGWAAWVPARIWSLVPDLQDIFDRRALAGLLANDRRLRRTLQPYVDGGLGVPSWAVGDLYDVIGYGVARQVLADARVTDAGLGFDGFYDAAEAEIDWRSGSDALPKAQAALEALPRQEVLLRARVTAIAADAAYRGGDPFLALSYYEDALLLDAGVYRRLGVALPARIEVHAIGQPSRYIGQMLESSPRFSGDSDAFVVSVDGDSEDLSICLYGATGARLSCADASRPVPTDDRAPIDDWTFAQQAVAEFYDTAFAMPLGVSLIDVDSLDGTARVADELERARANELLDAIP